MFKATFTGHALSLLFHCLLPLWMDLFVSTPFPAYHSIIPRLTRCRGVFELLFPLLSRSCFHDCLDDILMMCLFVEIRASV